MSKEAENRKKKPLRRQNHPHIRLLSDIIHILELTCKDFKITMTNMLKNIKGEMETLMKNGHFQYSMGIYNKEYFTTVEYNA